jgi:hypothetical protein
MVCGPSYWIRRRDSIPSSLRLSLPPVLRGKKKESTFPSLPFPPSFLPFFPSPHLYFPLLHTLWLLVALLAYSSRMAYSPGGSSFPPSQAHRPSFRSQQHIQQPQPQHQQYQHHPQIVAQQHSSGGRASERDLDEDEERELGRFFQDDDGVDRQLGGTGGSGGYQGTLSACSHQRTELTLHFQSTLLRPHRADLNPALSTPRPPLSLASRLLSRPPISQITTPPLRLLNPPSPALHNPSSPSRRSLSVAISLSNTLRPATAVNRVRE